jgi:hypothetical protein
LRGIDRQRSADALGGIAAMVSVSVMGSHGYLMLVLQYGWRRRTAPTAREKAPPEGF